MLTKDLPSTLWRLFQITYENNFPDSWKEKQAFCLFDKFPSYIFQSALQWNQRNRRIYAILNGSRPNMNPINFGIPQELVPTPTLFPLQANDSFNTDNKCHSYLWHLPFKHWDECLQVRIWQMKQNNANLNEDRDPKTLDLFSSLKISVPLIDIQKIAIVLISSGLVLLIFSWSQSRPRNKNA